MSCPAPHDLVLRVHDGPRREKRLEASRSTISHGKDARLRVLPRLEARANVVDSPVHHRVQKLISRHGGRVGVSLGFCNGHVSRRKFSVTPEK